MRLHLWDDRQIGPKEARAIIERSSQVPARASDHLWIARSADERVGYYGLWTFFDEAQPQILYVTDPHFAGRGFGKEAGAAVVAFAFGRLDLGYLDATADEGNTASIALARALGFLPHSRRKGPTGTQFVLRLEDPALA